MKLTDFDWICSDKFQYNRCYSCWHWLNGQNIFRIAWNNEEWRIILRHLVSASSDFAHYNYVPTLFSLFLSTDCYYLSSWMTICKALDLVQTFLGDFSDFYIVIAVLLFWLPGYTTLHELLVTLVGVWQIAGTQALLLLFAFMSVEWHVNRHSCPDRLRAWDCEVLVKKS